MTGAPVTGAMPTAVLDPNHGNGPERVALSSAAAANADRLAAITSAVISLAIGAGKVYDLGEPNKVIMDLNGGYVLVSSISAGATLGVLATRQAKLGDLGYEMAVFANRAGEVISPQLIEELKSSVGS